LTCFFANEKARTGDFDGAIELSRTAIEHECASADMINLAAATATLVNALLRKGGAGDLQEAQAAIDRLAAVPTEPGFVLHDLWLLSARASQARARGDETAYQDYRDRYRAMARTLGFEGHIAWAEAMP
jgi:adenylate cyclase